MNPALLLIRHTAGRLRVAGRIHDADALDLAVKALQPREEDLAARVRRLFGSKTAEEAE